MHPGRGENVLGIFAGQGRWVGWTTLKKTEADGTFSQWNVVGTAPLLPHRPCLRTWIFGQQDMEF